MENEIGNNIKALRKQLKLTQEELAEKCNLNRNSIYKYEKGETTPKMEQLIKIATALKVEISELLPYHITIGGELMIDNELDPQKQIINDLKILNTKGKYEAAKRVHELTKLDEYTKKEGE